jgi:RimJ/RimL family protein N-acetyltransferase
LENVEVSGNLSRVPHPYPQSAAVEFINRVGGPADPIDQKFAIVDRDGQFCGMTGYSRNGNDPQLGYYLDPLHWGKGYMTEATSAVLSWIFEVSDFEKVKSGAFEHNKASMAIQTKLGFKEVGRSTLHCLALERDLPHIDTQLTKDAFIPATQSRH